MLPDRMKKAIRQIPDFPKPGINFYDISTLLLDGPLFKEVVQELGRRYQDNKPEAIVGIEARGFIFAAALAVHFELPFIPLRKPGKLPAETAKMEYSLEYGTDALEIHKDAITPGMSVLLVDDLLATGGTARAGCDLLNKLGGDIIECVFILELSFLNGREKIGDYPAYSMLKYDE